MSKTVSSQPQNNGQQLINYNGQWKLATKGIDGKLRVYDDKSGKYVEVDPNDLFGINKKFKEEQQARKERLNASFNEQIESRNKWIDYYHKIQGKYSEIYDNATKALYTARKAWNIASSEHDTAERRYNAIVESSASGKVEDLSASEQADARMYQEQMDSAASVMKVEDRNKSAARSTQISSEWYIRTSTTDLITEAGNKHKIECQKAVAEHIMDSFG